MRFAESGNAAFGGHARAGKDSDMARGTQLVEQDEVEEHGE
jgi:hypothetical protein